MVGQLAQAGDDVVGREQAVAPGARAVPAGALRVARATRRARRSRPARVVRVDAPGRRRQRPQDAPDVAHDGDVDRDVLADLGRVDVDMDDARVRRIRADLAGHAVVEAHAQRDEQVGRLDGAVDVLPAVHAHVAVGERVRARRWRRRRAACGRPGSASSRRTPCRSSIASATRTPWPARIDRALGLLDLRGREADLARDGPRTSGLKPGRSIVSGCGARVSLVRASLVMSTWTGPGRPVRAMWNASAMTRGDVVGVADQVVVLGHRQRDAGDVDLLEGVLADERAGHVAGDGDHRDRVELGGARCR